MSRKHYRAVAQILATARGLTDDADVALDYVTRELASLFKADNSNFDYAKFYDAAELVTA